MASSRAILFDLDNTLIDESAAVAAAFQATAECAAGHCAVDAGTLADAARRHSERLWRANPEIAWCRDIGISSWEGLTGTLAGDAPPLAALRSWITKYRLDAWGEALRECGATAGMAAELAAQYPLQRACRHARFPDTIPVLQALKPEFSLALVTNGAPDILRGKLRGADLEPFFSVVVISGEYGRGKPDPGIFRHAARQLQVPADSCIMIGDRLDLDVAGARGAGMRGIWLNRGGKASPLAIMPDAELHDLLALREWLLEPRA